MTRSGGRPERASVACAKDVTVCHATAAQKEAAGQSPAAVAAAAAAAAGMPACHCDGQKCVDGGDRSGGSPTRNFSENLRFSASESQVAWDTELNPLHEAIYLGFRATATWPVRIDLGFRVHCRGSAWMGSSASLLMPLRAPTIPASSEQIVKWSCPHTFPAFGLPHRHRGVVTRQASGREGIPGWACAHIQKVR